MQPFKRLPKIKWPSKKRLLLGGGWILVMVYLVFGMLGSEIKNYFNLKQAIQREENLISRYKKKLKEEKNKLTSYQKGFNSTQKKLIESFAQDPYTLVSQIQKLMEDIPGLKIKTFRITSTRELSEGMKLISVHFSLEGDIKALAELLRRFSSKEVIVKLKSLNIYSFRRGNSWVLNIDLDVEALLYYKMYS